MSFILDALRKAERDRQLERPPLVTRIARAPVTLQAPPRYRPWVLLAAVVLMTLALIRLGAAPSPVSEGAEAEGAPSPAAVGVEQASAPETRLPAGPNAPEPVAEPEPAPAAMTVESIETPPAPPPVIAPVDEAPPAIEAPESLLTLDDLLDEGAEDDAVAVIVEPAEDQESEPPAIDQDTAASRRWSPPVPDSAPKKAVIAEDGPQLLRDMSAEFRSSFPAVSIDVHVFDTDPARRWVLVQGRRYGEGDTLPQGTRVDTITPKGTVLGWLDQLILIPLTP